MNKLISVSVLLLALQVSVAHAVLSPLVQVEGVVDNFDTGSVELTLGNGAKISVPRASLSKKADLRPGARFTASVRLDQMKPAGKKTAARKISRR